MSGVVAWVGSLGRLVGVVALLGLIGPSAAGAQAHREAPQVVPLALDRVFATSNSKLDIDGVDDKRVNVDIAILDTGIQLDHPDVDIVSRTDCTNATWPYSGPDYECTSASPDDGDEDVPGITHGTGSAVSVAGFDNGIGRVGIAAGARLWSVDISGPERYGAVPAPDPLPDPTFNLEYLIAGIRWVTAHADQIEVVHLAGLCIPEASLPPGSAWPTCAGTDDVDLVAEFEDALADSLAAGVFYVTGGREYEMDTFVPGRFHDLFFTTFVADSDGLPGGLGADNCRGTDDDHSVVNSSWGTAVDIASIGCAGSGAAPHVTAAAAVLASRDNPNNLSDVQDIAATITAAGNDGWTDDSPDGIREPLLDVGDEGVFDPVTVPGQGDTDTAGMFRPGDGTWGLRAANSGGWVNYSFSYSWDSYTDTPLAGDWDGDGVDTVGVFRRDGGIWSLRNTNSAGLADLEFAYAWGASWDVPLVGDWDGDGDDTIGMYRPGGGEWNLRNSNSSGGTDVSITQPISGTDIPLTGDWDGDGDDTIGVFRPSTGMWYLKNSNASGPPDMSFAFYWGSSLDIPLVGDWDGDGDDTIGMYRPGSGTWNLRNSNSAGPVEVEFSYYWGALADRPVTGDWDG